MNRIKHFRELAKLTQSELGRRLGCGQSRIANYENGIRTADLDTCRRIVAVLSSEIEGTISLDEVFPPNENVAQAIHSAGAPVCSSC